MAAEAAVTAGASVDLYEAKGSVGRKFLIAGRGGLNLTHSDAPDRFASRYGARADEVARWLRAFGPDLRRFLGKALSNRVVVAAVFVKRHEAQLTAEAEQALPGPLELP